MIDLSKDYYNIFNDIDGFFVIDINEKVVFMSDNLIRQVNKTRDEVIGTSILDLIPTNTAYKILKTGEKQIGEMYFVEGFTIVSNGYPIYKDGQLVGAFEYDVFANIGFVEEFLYRVDTVGDRKNIRRLKNDYKKAKYSIEDIKGSSLAIQKLKAQIRAAAKSNSTVMITGETGCGKELVAHAIHKLSQRSLFHFVKLNCAAIPSELFESEIFGYEEGSFTGAKKGGQYGKAEIANNGTIFLDEIDNLTLNMQAKILRFIQEKEVLRVGGDFPIPVNTRIIVATNQDARSLVEKELMREDLFYRLNVIEITVPPLRERREDIPELVESIMSDLNQHMGRTSHPVRHIEDKALLALMSYHWPGNIRELRNIVERGMNRCETEQLNLDQFDDFIKNYKRKDQGNTSLSINCIGRSLREVKNEVEEYAIKTALELNDQNFSKTAEDLGISRQMLHRKIKSMKENENKQKFTAWSRT